MVTKTEEEFIILSVKEYAALRDRDPETIRRWIKAKKVKATQFAPGHAWEIEVPVREYNRYTLMRHRPTS